MIKTQNLVPSVYYNHSRDFQILGRAYDIIFNYLKANIDTIYSIPLSDNSDRALLNLLCTTLGFKIKHQYSDKQLFAVCTMFMTLIKNKGSLKAIQDTVNIILQVQNINEETEVFMSNDNMSVEVYIPSTVNISLLNDLLDYILPAGITCNVYTSVQFYRSEKTVIKNDSEIIFKKAGTTSKTTAISSSETSYIQNFDADTETTIPASMSGGTIDNSTIVPDERTQ